MPTDKPSAPGEPAPSNNPLFNFFSPFLEHFKAESIRLKDTQPLTDYHNLFGTCRLIWEKLGTIEHEVALAKFAGEVKAAAREAAAHRQETWGSFKRNRTKAIATERSMARRDAESGRLLLELKRTYEDVGTKAELREAMQPVLQAAQRAYDAGKSINTGWRRTAWLLFVADIRSYGLIVRYQCARVLFFLFRHSFIFATSIIIFGLGYSELTKRAILQLAANAPTWPWVATVLAIAFGLAKKYLVDPRIKKLQVKLETKRLKLLALKLHSVRAFALASRVANRQPSTRKMEKAHPDCAARQHSN